MFLGPGSSLLAKGLTYGKKAMDFMRDPTIVFNPISYIGDKIANSSAYKSITASFLYIRQK